MSQSTKSLQRQRQNRIVPILISTIFIGLFAISAMMLFRHHQVVIDTVIHQDLKKLQKILQKIHKDCKIISFEHEKNYIDFLNVKEFVGSEVGAMNLAYAQNWKGPYMKDNPTIQEKQYIIFCNNQGCFIVPGDGVILNNGKKMGVDIILDQKTDMNKLLKDSQGLMSVHGALGVKIDVGVHRVRKMLAIHDVFVGTE